MFFSGNKTSVFSLLHKYEGYQKAFCLGKKKEACNA